MSSRGWGSLCRETTRTHLEERHVTVRLNPYLGFDSQAREAIQFYESVFGGELTVST